MPKAKARPVYNGVNGHVASMWGAVLPDWLRVRVWESPLCPRPQPRRGRVWCGADATYRSIRDQCQRSPDWQQHLHTVSQPLPKWTGKQLLKPVTLIFHTIILSPFSSTFTCNWPFISLLDSEASGSSAWLASLQPLQQAALQCPPPLCGLPTAQLQLTGQKQLGPGFEFGELWQCSIRRKPLWPSKVCPFTAQCRQGHLCHSWDWLYLLQVRRSGIGKMLFKK